MRTIARAVLEADRRGAARSKADKITAASIIAVKAIEFSIPEPTLLSRGAPALACAPAREFVALHLRLLNALFLVYVHYLPVLFTPKSSRESLVITRTSRDDSLARAGAQIAELFFNTYFILLFRRLFLEGP